MRPARAPRALPGAGRDRAGRRAAAGHDAGSDPVSDLPLLTVDLDGVICGPPFRVNLGIGRRLIDADAPPPRAFVPPRWLAAPLDHLRFDFRPPLPEAREALSMLSGVRRVVVLTGRRSSPARWLQRHRLDGLVERVIINDSADASPHFKLRHVQALAAAEHIDDDGSTAQLLAERGPARVYVRDWPRNRGLPRPERVTRVRDLLELARLLTAPSTEGRDAPDAGAPSIG